MTGTSLTLALGGNVPLDDLAESMVRLRVLLAALSDEVGGRETIRWTVADLQGGSAVATFAGDAARLEPILLVVQAYEAVGHALEQGRPIPFSPRVRRAATDLVSVIGEHVTSVRFETDSSSATIGTPIPEEIVAPLVSFGSVEGRVATLRRRPRVTMTIYDTRTDKAIACLLRADQAGQVQETWNRRVRLDGRIKRDAVSGQITEISDVERIEILPEIVRGAFRRARGAAPVHSGAESVEDTVRRLRDA